MYIRDNQTSQLIPSDHPVLILDATLDLAYVETGIADGFGEPDARDCELLEWQGKEVFGRVVVPEVDSAL